MRSFNNNRGFTLIELLLAMAISGVVMTAIYSTYLSQQKSYIVQEEVAAVQQKLRGAMYYMTRQIQEAGCNPSCNQTNPPGIITANVNEIRFTADVRGVTSGSSPDGDTNDPFEDITYSLVTSGDTQSLCVTTPAVNSNQPEPIAENTDALDFVYLDQNGTVLDDDGSGNVTTMASIGKIRSVEVTLVVRAEKEDKDYVNDIAYENQRGNEILPAQNDHYRRRCTKIQIKCRNLPQPPPGGGL